MRSASERLAQRWQPRENYTHDTDLRGDDLPRAIQTTEVGLGDQIKIIFGYEICSIRSVMSPSRLFMSIFEADDSLRAMSL
jgi:hypothetical protein